MYHQAGSAARGQEQKQVTVGCRRWIGHLSNHFHHRIPIPLLKLDLVYIYGAYWFYQSHCQPRYLFLITT